MKIDAGETMTGKALWLSMALGLMLIGCGGSDDANAADSDDTGAQRATDGGSDAAGADAGSRDDGDAQGEPTSDGSRGSGADGGDAADEDDSANAASDDANSGGDQRDGGEGDGSDGSEPASDGGASGGEQAASDERLTGDLCEASFDACGGDPTGSWEVVSACWSREFFATLLPCGEAQGELGLDISGTIEIEPSMIGSDITATYVIDQRTPVSCIAPQSCEEAFADLGGASEQDGVCVSSRREPGSDTTADSEISIEGSEIIELDGGGFEFCQQGDHLTLKTVLAEDDEYQLLELQRL